MYTYETISLTVMEPTHRLDKRVAETPDCCQQTAPPEDQEGHAEGGRPREAQPA